MAIQCHWVSPAEVLGPSLIGHRQVGYSTATQRAAEHLVELDNALRHFSCLFPHIS